jgi:hypothetical protein
MNGGRDVCGREEKTLMNANAQGEMETEIKVAAMAEANDAREI